MAAECCSTDHVGVLLPKIKKIPKNTNGRLAIPALAGLLVTYIWLHCVLSTLRPARCYQQGADGTDHGLTSCYTYRHRRRSREGPQVWTLTIMLWGSAMAWTLTIIWLHYRICSFLMFQTVHLECHQQRSFTLKMHQNRWAKYDLRKYFFSNRIVNIWNSLPGHVVIADTVNCFKSRLDKFWANQELMYNFRSENHGTGSRSEVIHLVIHLVRPLPVWRRVTWRIVGLLVHEKVDLSVSQLLKSCFE